jgi:peptide/nickel transport system substrate-binding protein
MHSLKNFKAVLRRVALLALLATTVSAAFAQTELVIAQSTDITGFDVHNVRTASAESVFVNVFDYLVMRGAQGGFEPSLAASWEITADTTWRFHLRDDVLWHDGSRFTAADVEYSLERVAFDTTLTSNQVYSHITDVEVIDDFTVDVHTAYADPILLHRLSSLGAAIVPAAYIAEVGWEGFDDRPVGTGPYKVVEWRRDDRLIMEAFDEHFRGRPAFDRLVHRVIPEDSTRVNELITSGIQVAAAVPPFEIDRVNASGTAQVLPQPSPRVMLLVMNTAPDRPTGDPRVREALDYAIDDRLLVDGVMGGFGVPVLGRVGPAVTGSPMDLYDTYNYDPERAVRMLAEAGYGPGELTLKIQSPMGRYPMDSDLAQIIGVMFEAVGINVELEILEWGAYAERIWDADKIEHMALMGLSNTMFDGWYPQRAILCDGTYRYKTNWCNPEFDAAVNAAAMEMDEEKRAGFIAEAYYIVAEDRPQIMLFQGEDLVGLSTDVEWTPRQDSLLWMFEARPR